MRTSLIPPVLVALALCAPHALALQDVGSTRPPKLKAQTPDCFDTLSCLVFGVMPEPVRDDFVTLYSKNVFVCVYADHDGLGLGERTSGECHYLAFVPLGSNDRGAAQVLLP